LETNYSRQPVRHLAQIISWEHLQGHYNCISKIVMEILMPLMVAYVSLADVCSAVEICRIMVIII